VQIFGILSGLATALAVVGIYGVMSYTVRRQTHEMGVRMAGANSRDVLALILKHGLKLTVPGIALGLAGAFGLTRLIRSMLYGVPPADPLTFSIVSGKTFAMRFACYAMPLVSAPAYRSAGVSPPGESGQEPLSRQHVT